MTMENTVIGRLEKEGRLFDAVLKGPTTKPGRYGFRGDIALKFQTQVGDEARPPDCLIEQVLMVAQEGETTIPVLAGYLQDFSLVKDVGEVLGDYLKEDGVYFMFCNNIDLLQKYSMPVGKATIHILPCDESTVWKEMMELLSIDKNDIKKLDTAGKTDYVLDAAMAYKDKFEPLTYERGLQVMEPVKNRNENRPV